MGKWRRKESVYLLLRLFLLPHGMSVSVLVHSVATVLSSMTGIRDLKVSCQNLKNMRTGLKEPTFLSSHSFRAWKDLSFSNTKFKGPLPSWTFEKTFKVTYLKRVRPRREDRRELPPFPEFSSYSGCFFFYSFIEFSWEPHGKEFFFVIIHFTDVKEVRRLLAQTFQLASGRP